MELQCRRKEWSEDEGRRIRHKNDDEDIVYVKNIKQLNETTNVHPREDAVALKYQSQCDVSDVEASSEEDECELGTRPIDPGHGSEIRDSEMTVGSIRRADEKGDLLVCPRRFPALCDSGAVGQRAPPMASHVVGVAGVDDGEDDEGSQHRRVRQSTMVPLSSPISYSFTAYKS